MSCDFVRWTGPWGHNGIYYDTKAKNYVSTVSDLHNLTFKTEEELIDWIYNVYYGGEYNDGSDKQDDGEQTN